MKPEITPGYPFGEYKVRKDALTKEEQKIFESFIDLLFGRMGAEQFCKVTGLKESESLESFIASRDKTLIGKPLPMADVELFRNNISPFLAELGVDAKKVASAISDSVHGYKTIQPLFFDDDLEEIMINGVGIPVFVFHRIYSTCRTNLAIKSDHEMRILTNQLGAEDTKVHDDMRLADGARANITFEPAAESTTITIRKFRQKPMSIIDLIKNGTISAEIGGFLWLSIEGWGLYPLNVMIVGGTASGKTTTLNALGCIIPPHERIVSIEDTREINFGNRENWIQLETAKSATLEGLVKNSLRMRPDRIIVGEIRGAEAEDLFTAMNVGHRGTLSTIHANSDRDCVKRLENQPMRVPRPLLPLIDVIVVQNRLRDSRTGRLVRRVVQVSEVSRLEDEIALNEIYAWNSEEGRLLPTKLPSQSKEKLSRATSTAIRQVNDEIERRTKMLEYLCEKNVSEYERVNEFMKTYYSEQLPRPG